MANRLSSNFYVENLFMVIPTREKILLFNMPFKISSPGSYIEITLQYRLTMFSVKDDILNGTHC